jgi:rhodanese-related sulfurtransferase
MANISGSAYIQAMNMSLSPWRRRLLKWLVCGSLWPLAAAGQPDSDMVSLETARAEFEAGRAILIDIREPAEHATGVAAGAQLLPMRQLSNRWKEIPTDPQRPVLLICNTQNRSAATLKALRQQGYSHVRYVSGGMSEWVRRGWPVVKPSP